MKIRMTDVEDVSEGDICTAIGDGCEVVLRKGNRFLARNIHGWCFGILFDTSVGRKESTLALLHFRDFEDLDGDVGMYHHDFLRGGCFHKRSGPMAVLLRKLLEKPAGWSEETLKFIPEVIEHLT
jgi:hypothetical protein